MKNAIPHGPHGPHHRKPCVYWAFRYIGWPVAARGGPWLARGPSEPDRKMYDLTFETYRATDFTPDSFAQTVERVALALPDLETATIKAWQRAQHPALKMTTRVVVTGLHLWRKWKLGQVGFLAYAADHVWKLKGQPVADPGAYAELRRFLPRTR